MNTDPTTLHNTVSNDCSEKLPELVTQFQSLQQQSTTLHTLQTDYLQCLQHCNALYYIYKYNNHTTITQSFYTVNYTVSVLPSYNIYNNVYLKLYIKSNSTYKFQLNQSINTLICKFQFHAYNTIYSIQYNCSRIKYIDNQYCIDVLLPDEMCKYIYEHSNECNFTCNVFIQYNVDINYHNKLQHIDSNKCDSLMNTVSENRMFELKIGTLTVNSTQIQST